MGVSDAQQKKTAEAEERRQQRAAKKRVRDRERKRRQREKLPSAVAARVRFIDTAAHRTSREEQRLAKKKREVVRCVKIGAISKLIKGQDINRCRALNWPALSAWTKFLARRASYEASEQEFDAMASAALKEALRLRKEEAKPAAVDDWRSRLPHLVTTGDVYSKACVDYSNQFNMELKGSYKRLFPKLAHKVTRSQSSTRRSSGRRRTLSCGRRAWGLLPTWRVWR